jgi:hypothetical protein
MINDINCCKQKEPTRNVSRWKRKGRGGRSNIREKNETTVIAQSQERDGQRSKEEEKEQTTECNSRDIESTYRDVGVKVEHFRVGSHG